MKVKERESFRVGDKVECIKRFAGHCELGDHDEIIRVDSVGDPVLKKTGAWTSRMFFGYYKAIKRGKAEFKAGDRDSFRVGDRVEAIYEAPSRPSYKIGWLGTVKSVDNKDMAYVKFDDDLEETYIHYDRIVKEGGKVKFKVGDIVECIDQNCEYYDGKNTRPMKGGIYRVSCVTSKGHGNYVGLDNDVRTGWLEGHFRLVEEGSINFQVGDKVKVKDCPKLRTWHKWKEILEKEFILTQENIEEIEEGGSVFLDKNSWMVNFEIKWLILIGRSRGMGKFKKGDKVIVNKGSTPGKEYDGGCVFALGMGDYREKEAIIVAANDFDYGRRYTLDIDKGNYQWTDSMLEASTLGLSKFQVGDQVKQITSGWNTDCKDNGKEAIVTQVGLHYIDGKDGIVIKPIGFWDWATQTGIRGENAFEKVKKEEIVDQYDKIRDQIEDLEDGWDQEADELITEIGYSGRLVLDYAVNNGSGNILVVTHGEWIDKTSKGRFDVKESFWFDGQCGRMAAFKKALVYMLDNSRIKKSLVGQEVKAEIEGKIYQVKVLDTA